MLAGLALVGCGSSAAGPSSAAAGTIAIDAGEHRCAVADTTLPAGRHVFEVTNSAAQVSEVYVYAAGDQVVGEVENIGPSTTRSLTVDLPSGRYEVACKPGMVGRGNRTTLHVFGR